ncbi:hypothetical protein Cgig2_015638 [Carnegiea gigantea]|uniref:Uncharacterized protein n=1 Tax=Carnegiea gigantea TaxID=171969 RepID=A0A9Q1K2G3_9CARY|nr:hypothetical protein Cgig2_015638 [Carnegiea gigantea]
MNNFQQEQLNLDLAPCLRVFLEVECTSSGKVRRFAQGTKAGFALSLINNKLEAGAPLGLYIEAVKDGEEPITFGPSSVLVSYGNGWRLQTVVDYQGFKKREYNQVVDVITSIGADDIVDPNDEEEELRSEKAQCQKEGVTCMGRRAGTGVITGGCGSESSGGGLNQNN